MSPKALPHTFSLRFLAHYKRKRFLNLPNNPTGNIKHFPFIIYL